MLATTDNKTELNDTPVSDTSKHTCVHCRHEEFTTDIQGYDFDTGEKSFDLETCCQCQLTRTAPLLNDDQLSEYYASSYYGSSEKKFNPFIEAWTVWSNIRLAKKILASYKKINTKRDNLKVLDIGCGRANLLKAFKQYGNDCIGIERGDFPESSGIDGIKIYKQDLLEAPLEEQSLDIVVIWHVLEHLTNPSAVLKRINKLLKPDGLLVVAVPNFGGTQSKLFRKHWFHLDLPRHTYHFSQDSLSRLLGDNRLSIQSVSTNCIDQSIFGFIQSALNMLGLGKPNTLYSILKTDQNKPNMIMTAMQILLAGILLPFSVIEYIASCLTKKGACLIVNSRKLP